MRFVLTVLILLPQTLVAQNAEGLRARIEAHYVAIHAGDVDAVVDHHLSDMTIFPETGHVLLEPGWADAGTRMGADVPFPALQVVMRHFSAQIYGDVGIAAFYLDGLFDGERRTSRVSAVWVWRNGQWMEAHHHESRLVS